MSKSPIKKPLAIILGLFLIIILISLFGGIKEARAASAVTVLSPNGGEEWVIGNSYNITWEGKGVEKFDIFLLDYGRCAYAGDPPTCVTPAGTLIVSDISANLGKYSWKIPSNIVPSDKYKISLEDGHFIYDNSDNYFSIVEKTTECFPDGTLIKLPGDPKIYVIINCQKKWIRTVGEFEEGGYKWSDVQEVSSPVIEAYAEYLEAKAELLRAIGQHRVYRIINGKRLWIPTIAAFNAQGLKWDDIEESSESTVNSYPRANLLRATRDPKVYYLTESGLKRHLISPEIFTSYNNQWDDIVEVTATQLEAYPDNILIKLEDGYQVYKIENGQKRWIKTVQAFNRLGYDWNKIAPVNSTELNAYPTGTEIE